MAIVYNQIGSLTELLNRCREKGITFDSMEQVEEFLNSYHENIKVAAEKAEENFNKTIGEANNTLNIAVENYEVEKKAIVALIDNKLAALSVAIATSQSTTTNPISKILNNLRVNKYTQARVKLENNYDAEIEKHLKIFTEEINNARSDLNYKLINHDILTTKYKDDYINKLQHTYEILMENGAFLYGAKGEHMALIELKKLPDTYTVINNACFNFRPGIHDKGNNDWIYSAQIDHVVVGPTGIFLIETKNWRQESTTNKDFFSPVKQINRSGLAIYVRLNNAIKDGYLISFNIQWGTQKITMKKLVLLTGYSQSDEYDFVKLVTLRDLRSYITYGKLVYNETQIKDIVRFFREEGYGNNTSRSIGMGDFRR